jgi:hypothetical protein
VPVNLPCSVAPIRYSWPVPRDAIDSNSDKISEKRLNLELGIVPCQRQLWRRPSCWGCLRSIVCGTSARSPAVPLDLIQGVDHSGVVLAMVDPR